MSYAVGQKIWTEGVDTNNIFLTPAEGDFIASRINSGLDMNLGSTAADDEASGYMDECLYLKNGATFKANTTYYFHGRIMRLPSNQTFNVQLRVLDGLSSNETDTTMQYIKKIVVAKKETNRYNNWVDVHFLFTPIVDSFNALTFTLARSAMAGDFNPNTIRFPSIIYEELSTVRNYITDGFSYTKIGVQTHPGLELCINGEEITVGRSGVYELKNDLISVNSFSVISAAEEVESEETDNTIYRDEETWEEIEPLKGLKKAEYDLSMKYWGWDIPHRLETEVRPYPESDRLQDIENIMRPHASVTEDNEEVVNATVWSELVNDESPTSDCRIKVAKKRLVDGFILDYMYEN